MLAATIRVAKYQIIAKQYWPNNLNLDIIFIADLDSACFTSSSKVFVFQSYLSWVLLHFTDVWSWMRTTSSHFYATHCRYRGQRSVWGFVWSLTGTRRHALWNTQNSTAADLLMLEWVEKSQGLPVFSSTLQKAKFLVKWFLVSWIYVHF